MIFSGPKSYYDDYLRKKDTARSLTNPPALLTDRGAYLNFLEVQLERVSAACIGVQSYEDRINDMQNMIVSLEQRCGATTRLVSLAQQCTEEVRSEANQRLNTLGEDLKNESGKTRESLSSMINRLSHAEVTLASLPNLESRIIDLSNSLSDVKTKLHSVEVDNAQKFQQFQEKIESLSYNSLELKSTVQWNASEIRRVQFEAHEKVAAVEHYCKKVEQDTEKTSFSRRVEALSAVEKVEKEFAAQMQEVKSRSEEYQAEMKQLVERVDKQLSTELMENQDKWSEKLESISSQMEEKTKQKVEVVRKLFSDRISEIHSSQEQQIQQLKELEGNLISQLNSLNSSVTGIEENQSELEGKLDGTSKIMESSLKELLQDIESEFRTVAPSAESVANNLRKRFNLGSSEFRSKSKSTRIKSPERSGKLIKTSRRPEKGIPHNEEYKGIEEEHSSIELNSADSSDTQKEVPEEAKSFLNTQNQVHTNFSTQTAVAPSQLSFFGSTQEPSPDFSHSFYSSLQQQHPKTPHPYGFPFAAPPASSVPFAPNQQVFGFYPPWLPSPAGGQVGNPLSQEDQPANTTSATVQPVVEMVNKVNPFEKVEESSNSSQKPIEEVMKTSENKASDVDASIVDTPNSSGSKQEEIEVMNQSLQKFLDSYRDDKSEILKRLGDLSEVICQQQSKAASPETSNLESSSGNTDVPPPLQRGTNENKTAESMKVKSDLSDTSSRDVFFDSSLDVVAPENATTLSAQFPNMFRALFDNQTTAEESGSMKDKSYQPMTMFGNFIGDPRPFSQTVPNKHDQPKTHQIKTAVNKKSEGEKRQKSPAPRTQRKPELGSSNPRAEDFFTRYPQVLANKGSTNSTDLQQQNRPWLPVKTFQVPERPRDKSPLIVQREILKHSESSRALLLRSWEKATQTSKGLSSSVSTPTIDTSLTSTPASQKAK